MVGKEKIVQRKVILFLREMGWLVINTSSASKASSGLRGFPDLVCHKKDFTLYIETKAKGARLRDSQQSFREDILPLCGDHLDYIVVAEFEPFRKLLDRHYFKKFEWERPKGFWTWEAPDWVEK